MKHFLQIIRERKKSFIFLSFLLIFNVGLFTYRHFYQAPKLEKLQMSLFEKRSMAKGGETRTSGAIYRDGLADISSFRERIPLKKEYTRLVGELMQTAADNSLSSGAITYRPAPLKGENLLAYTISMDVVGKYAAVKSFVFDVQHFPEIITIDALSLNGTSVTEDSVNMKVQLTAYLRTEGK